MNVLIFGSGGRESAFAWSIAQSGLLSNLYLAPGNPGMAQLGTCIDLDWRDRELVADFCVRQDIHIVLVGPEEPLVHGLADYFAYHPELERIHFIGPQKEAAQLEGSKDFAKAFMMRHGIPTAEYRTFTKNELEKAKMYVLSKDGPYVLKADGLAAGKGVVILDDVVDALKELDSMLGAAKFGAASSRVVIEEHLTGPEFSVFVLTDGEGYILLPQATDYKRVGEGQTGPNTGGMGAISPVPFVTPEIIGQVHREIIQPTLEGLKAEHIPYCGFIFFGLMLTAQGPKVIEYNVRMGDPETEAVLARLDEDLLALMVDAARGHLATRPAAVKPDTAITVVLTAPGYPGDYPKGLPIQGVELASEGSLLFHAGTAEQDGQLVTNGGRVLAVTGLGSDVDEAKTRAYARVDQLNFEGKQVRRDIGTIYGWPLESK
ncbi:MAG: phosphoribosylamine--glycine ligase [Schleiferiaceae bacterium]